MSELKVIDVDKMADVRSLSGQFYRKSKADKVISGKDKEIQRLEKLCENYRCDCDNLAIMTDKLKKAGRSLRQNMNHQKYRRCLAMAKMCDEVMMSCELRGYTVLRIWANKHEWAMRWKYRWLELAEKFKEAK